MADDTEFDDRPTVVLELPIQGSFTIPRPESVILKIGRARFDIGSFCYAFRSRSAGTRNGRRGVVLSSLLPHRAVQMKKVIQHLSSRLSDQGSRSETVVTTFKYLASYLNWADLHGHRHCLGTSFQVRPILEAWILECEERFRRSDWSARHAWASQSAISALLCATTGNMHLKDGLRLIRSRPSNGGTEPVPEGDFARVLAINEALFTGLSALVLENRPYPFRLPMPPLPGWLVSHLWVFPTHRWYLPPHLQGPEREQLAMPLWSFDFVNGRVSSFEDIKQHYRMPCLARLSIRQAEEAIERANADFRHPYRKQAARAAHDAFFMLFVAHTGLNEAVVRELLWDREISAEAKQQGFREVKWRAGGKSISAMISARFMPSLKKFLALRRYILDGEACQWLFIGGDKALRKSGQTSRGLLYKHYRLGAGIYPQLPAIGARALRATMHEWYNRNVDPVVTARLTGHRQETINRHYQAGTVGAQREELSVFLDKVATHAQSWTRIVPAAEMPQRSSRGPLGQCEAKGSATPIYDGVPITPGCSEPEECLFCAHHVVKADAEDVRKLASCAYVVEQTFHVEGAREHFRPALALIDAYLSRISTVLGSSALVDGIQADVRQHGNLDPYWAAKHAFLDSIGLLS